MERKGEDAEILLVDAGNSFLKIAFAAKSGICASALLRAPHEASPDSLGLDLLSLVRARGFSPGQFRACVACSVLPGFVDALKGALKAYFGCPLLLAQRDLSVPLDNLYHRPEEAGVDRLVAAWGARLRFSESPALILAGFGSVFTFDCVLENRWLGGLLFPGPKAACKALAIAAPALPHIEFDSSCFALADECKPERDTRSALRSGLLHAYVSLSRALCQNLAASLPVEPLLLASGGLAREISRLAGIFDAVLPQLVLEGLGSLYYENSWRCSD